MIAQCTTSFRITQANHLNLNPQQKALVQTKNNTRYRWIHHRRIEDKRILQKQTKLVKAMLSKHKEEKWFNTTDQVNEDHTKFWQVLRTMGRRRQPNAPLKANNGLVFLDSDKTELFATAFEQQCTNTDKVPIQINKEVIYSMQLLIHQQVHEDRFTKNQVASIIKQLKVR